MFIISLLFLQTLTPLNNTFTYIVRAQQGQSGDQLARSLGVPGYNDHGYSHVSIAFWTCPGSTYMAKIWENMVIPSLGKSPEEISNAILQKYKAAGKYMMLSLFGGQYSPTNTNPQQCFQNLTKYLDRFQFHGIDIDYQDVNGFYSGVAVKWLTTFTILLKKKYPNMILSNAPVAMFFSPNYNYVYETIQKSNIGPMINYYLIQYYNVGIDYTNYSCLFIKGCGFLQTAVKQIMDKGVPQGKIVVGKPALKGDAPSGGWVQPELLAEWCLKACKDFGWKGGFMTWQFTGDYDSHYVNAINKAFDECQKYQ